MGQPIYDQIYPFNNPAKLVDKTGNQINVIHPYRDKHGVWKFDDDQVGLRAEPFVGQINTMIDRFADGKEQVTVYISSEPIAGQTLSLTNVDEEVENNSTPDDFFYPGHYQLDGTDMVGWLCPATLKYFKDYPKKIYAKIEKYAN